MLIEKVMIAVLMPLNRLSVRNMKTGREDYDTSAGERTIRPWPHLSGYS